MAGGPGALLVLMVATVLGPLSALQHDFRDAERGEMMVDHPSSPIEVPAGETLSAITHASPTTPSKAEGEEEETLESLVDALQQVMHNAPPSALTPTPSDTTDALWLKVYRKHAKKQETLENTARTGKSTPSPTPPVLTLPSDPDISVSCVYQSPQLTTALKDLALILQEAALEKKSETLAQLVNGFSEILKKCF